MDNEFPLKKIQSRIISDTLPILGAILFAMYTANWSSFLTLQRSNLPISGIDDIKNGRLPFHRIGIVMNSSIVDCYIQNVSDVYYPLENTQDIYLALLENCIEAALADATSLEYIIDRNYYGHLSLVGVGFAKSSFGIAMKKH
jgi:ABC-type amino acid transport substrate-binding protein